MNEELPPIRQCPDCGLLVDMREHTNCRAKQQISTVRRGVEGAFRAGVIRGFQRAKGPPSNTNRCPKASCCLARNHKGPHKPWPPTPNINFKGRKPS